MDQSVLDAHLSKLDYLATCLGIPNATISANGDDSYTIKASGLEFKNIYSELQRMTEIVSGMGGRIVVKYGGLRIIIDLR
jgi:hypothetical protein